jgi:hypothetical protein
MDLYALSTLKGVVIAPGPKFASFRFDHLIVEDPHLLLTELLIVIRELPSAEEDVLH